MTPISSTELLPDYDLLFAGAGCAALSLLHRMAAEGLLAGKRVLLVDRDVKERNDRTWCFWERGAGPFESIVHHRWEQLGFHADAFSRTLNLGPYAYKVIRGADFYRHCRAVLEGFPDVHFLQAPVSAAGSDAGGAWLGAAGKTVQAPWLFNSIYTRPAPAPSTHWLLQHFKGWLIETAEPAFDPGRATLMDFRTGQEAGTAFVYVLPFSERRALVEYTLFTGELLPAAAYDAALAAYVRDRLGLSGYTVLEAETGVIPMTNHRFPAGEGRVINLGTAGGQTKGSSGYTFRNIQKHSAALVRRLKATGSPVGAGSAPGRFHFYDSVLLDVLAHGKVRGADIFTDLFRRNDPQKVLRFLDNESNLGEELGIIASLPTAPFARAALRQLTGL
ncbi:lycopene cyclase [Flaviaesturariibacter flavus]|uniref:Lycopene cyclase n=1 Tax=Flaviaesturariibacter flavus TaxID=2502780 RepID=A0A4R1BB39_9BACT|nr:lycopene cyclase family protein [Flaviaesturariibacter flavus]TCJ14205.1 lycopene cyclase [Flaviaesturariibacter flavus]